MHSAFKAFTFLAKHNIIFRKKTMDLKPNEMGIHSWIHSSNSALFQVNLLYPEINKSKKDGYLKNLRN